MISNHDILELMGDAVQSGDGVRLGVAGRSMGPAFATATDVRIIPCDATSIPVGRLVVFQREGRWVAHRVMRRESGDGGLVYLTKGDGLVDLDVPGIRSVEIKGMVSGWWSDGGRYFDLLSLRARISGWLVVLRYRLGRLIAPSGRGPMPGHRA